jgi:beta-fructofuranosidase
MLSLKEAQTRYEKARSSLDSSRRPRFHFSCPLGWMNDPNGFVFFKGYYHVFFQNHPFPDLEVGWGHVRSKDLFAYEELPLALVPEEPYENKGCFSGSALVKEDRLFLFYTGNSVQAGQSTQTQCLATSDDGIHFEKYSQNPILSARDLPLGVSSRDFRDPYIFQAGNRYFLLCGGKRGDEAVLLLFASDDLFHFSKGKVLWGSRAYGTMIECPSLLQVDGQGILLFSATSLKPLGSDYWNISSSLWAPVAFDPEKETLRFLQSPREIDHGLDFYAPQARSFLGRGILLAWMDMWGRKIPTLEKNEGWGTEFVLPRQLHYQDGRLIQKPLPEVEALFSKVAQKGKKIDSETLVYEDAAMAHLSLQIDRRLVPEFSLSFFSNGKEQTVLSYQGDLSELRFSRQEGGFAFGGEDPSEAKDGIRILPLERGKTSLALECYLDLNSVEIFVDGGISSFTAQVFNADDARSITLVSKAGFQGIAASLRTIAR